jgi:putative transposon-encoded protein
MDKFTVTLEGYDMIEKEVKNGGNSARVFVPKSWAGCRVKVVLLDEPTAGTSESDLSDLTQ